MELLISVRELLVAVCEVLVSVCELLTPVCELLVYNQNIMTKTNLISSNFQSNTVLFKVPRMADYKEPY